jgi:DNA-binding NtrC family response regulator
MLNILVADDDENVRESVGLALSSRGYCVTEASDGAEAAELISSRVFDLAICDVRMPRLDGLTLLRRIRREAPGTAVVIMTSFAEVPDVVGSMRDGAVDYVTKPFDPDEFTTRVVGPIAERRAVARRFDAARADFVARSTGVTLVGLSPRMSSLKSRIETLASSDASVVVRGDRGTGKGLVARTLHAQSPRRDGPLVLVEGVLLPEILEASAEQDRAAGGRTRDAWFRAASEGTLAIDEVDSLPLRVQAQLLRVLEEPATRARRGPSWQPLGVRVISLTRADLASKVAAGEFLESLYYQLNGVELHVPALRERAEDLCQLVTELLRELVPADTRAPGVSARAWSAIVRHDFSGNVRELRWALEQALALSSGREIDVGDLPATVCAAP